MSVERIAIENKQELEQMISKEINQIEKDLTVICTQVPINDKTTIDALCHDENGQLVILQVSTGEDDTALLQGIQSLDYVDKFKSFLKMTYSKHKIDDKEKPRLILVAPNFSDTLRHIVQNIQGLRIELYEWEYLKIGDHRGLHLQSIFTWKPANWKPAEKPVEETESKPVEKKNDQKTQKKKEPASAEKKEEAKLEPLKPQPETEQPEQPKEEFPSPPQHEEEEDFFKLPRKEEQPKKKRFF